MGNYYGLDTPSVSQNGLSSRHVEHLPFVCNFPLAFTKIVDGDAVVIK